MKTIILAAALLVAIPAAAQDSQMTPPTPEEMQKMMALMGPGPEHQDFETLVGTWDMTAKYSMGPGQTIEVKGRAENVMILGGRFLRSETMGTAPEMGMTVEAMTIYGFDRRTSEYTLVGYDTMGPYYVTAAGKREAGANEVVMQGEIEEHGDVKKYDMVLRWVDADTHVTEIIFHMPDGDLKVAEMTFTRAK